MGYMHGYVKVSSEWRRFLVFYLLFLHSFKVSDDYLFCYDYIFNYNEERIIFFIWQKSKTFISHSFTLLHCHPVWHSFYNSWPNQSCIMIESILYPIIQYSLRLTYIAPTFQDISTVNINLIIGAEINCYSL